ncbi:MAG: relaxase/mobilization nuclease domain-containing protein [Desulfovibrionaceae bacterium]
MLIKFLPRGTGDGDGPVDYCVSAVNPVNGKVRTPAPQVLRGDPGRTIRLINCLDFKHKYSSAVISFAPEDKPTSHQQRQLMNEFEAVAFSGLPWDGYDILWIRHEHCGRVELHAIIPRVELHSGKSYNPAPPCRRTPDGTPLPPLAYDLLRDT